MNSALSEQRSGASGVTSPQAMSDLIQEALTSESPSAATLLNRRLLAADGLLPPTDLRNSTTATGKVPTRVAIVSLLFNWPSTGGGIVHTAELAEFLTRDGFDVCHFFAVHPAWSVGGVSAPLPYNSVAIHFSESGWNREGIQQAFREALDSFEPHGVIITDSWNSKGLLAAAASKWPYYIRLAAMECLCPLNNVRLLVEPGGQIRQCRQTQLATRGQCVSCVRQNAAFSGSLHARERELAGFDSDAFDVELRTAFANAEAILVVNPLIGALCEPFARDVQIIPSGFNPKRFEQLPARSFAEGKIRILFAGLIEELMKGFHVVWDACCQLWKQRQDFELHVTADEGPCEAPFLRYRGWKSQEDLPGLMADCDVIVVPTIAQEALGRTAVEAMAAGRPVIASRLGGLPWVVSDQVTGLLFEPGDSSELCECLHRLADNPAWSQALGLAGRQQFEARFTWEQILTRHYRPLLARLRTNA